MGRERQEEAVVLQSSIALLQERFRELHRVKKEREERELLKLMMMLPDHHHHEPLEFTAPTTLFFQPESDRVLLPPKPPLMLSLSLWPYSQQSGKHDHLQLLEAKPTLFNDNLFSNEKAPTLLSKVDDFDLESNDDVDTSLHL
ncbi:hypothetical protein HS088_TW21G01001 [Tripterygium wilfordii]|uniref:Uncharacterized protein n=1 Tax=Tripterygium wilfordii TaxID=458696 RepID=A0A7J7C4S7_TRIWF|nr:hypothetical protein HS088_TW21G01001 [Tripterygium wilfordii]